MSNLQAMIWITFSLSTIIGGLNAQGELPMKVCNSIQLQKYGYMNAESLKKYENCTHVENNLILAYEVFGSPSEGIQSINELYVLRNVRVVRGIIHIDLDDSRVKLTNLTFLENLEEVLEYHRENNSHPLQVLGAPDLQFLGLRQLKKVSGGIRLVKNQNLCFLNNFKWSDIANKPNAMNGNRPAAVCEKEGKVCDPNCSPNVGCWGPGPDYCRACRNVKHGISCMGKCPIGLYPDSGKICQPCHSSCQSSLCTGPERGDCKNTCNYNDGNCGGACFRSAAGDCHSCSPKCYQGEMKAYESACSGPAQYVSLNGCNLCSKIILHEGDVNDKLCLKESEPCPAGYYEEKNAQTSAKYQFAPSLRSLSVCKPCYQNCTSCNGRGMTYPECDSCQAVWVGKMCQESCQPYLHYTIKRNSGPDFSLPSNEFQCFRCHSQCLLGCKDDSPKSCTKCKTFKVYDSGEESSQFSCVEKCPEGRDVIVKNTKTGESLCLSKAPLQTAEAGSGNSIWVIVGILVILFLLILLIIIAIIVYKRRKSQQLPTQTAHGGSQGKEEETENPETSKLMDNQDQSNEQK